MSHQKNQEQDAGAVVGWAMKNVLVPVGLGFASANILISIGAKVARRAWAMKSSSKKD